MNLDLRSVTFLSIPVPSPGVILGLHGLSYPPDALVHILVSLSLYSKALVPLRWYRRWIWQCWQWLLFPPLFQPYHRGSLPRPLLNLPWEFLEENSSVTVTPYTHECLQLQGLHPPTQALFFFFYLVSDFFFFFTISPLKSQQSLSISNHYFK